MDRFDLYLPVEPVLLVRRSLPLERVLPSPLLIVSDGHRGLAKAIEARPQAQGQRCTVHKWHNLVKHCPKHAHRELKRDYDRIVYAAASGMAAREAYAALVTKWRKLCPAVARSLKEAGEQLLTRCDPVA